MIPFPDISPEIFTIHLGERAFSLRWYALAYLVGLVPGALAAVAMTPAAMNAARAHQRLIGSISMFD